ADDDTLRAHAQTVADEIAHRDLPFALEIRRAGFETHDMRLLELKLGGVLACNDALVLIDGARQAVEERRLARARTAGNDRVAPAAADDTQYFRALGRHGAEPHHLIKRQFLALEFADREGRAVERQRRDDDVDARPVRQARIADRRAFVDAAADLADNALAEGQELGIVAGADIASL